MLALLYIKLPYDFLVPDGVVYKVFEFEKDGYRIVFDVPIRTNRSSDPEVEFCLNLDGHPAFLTDVLPLRFYKESFGRQKGSPLDPPETLINYSLNMFLSRLKYVTKASQVKPLNIRSCKWQLKYLQDNGSELEDAAGLSRVRIGGRISLTYIICDPKQWDFAVSLPHDFEPPEWYTLLVDAQGALPHLGAALVLAATALEVFVADILAALAKNSTVPTDLWAWINDRGDWRKEPSVEEQFDILLKTLCGHSLKEDNALWESFKKLRNARNSFVHNGIPKIGGSASTVSQPEAKELIEGAGKIVTAIHAWLPEHLKWPVLEYSAELGVGVKSKVITPETAAKAAAPQCDK